MGASSVSIWAAEDGWFQNEAASRGIGFVHEDGRSGEKYYIETAASGGGFLDYDADGDLDIYLVNGAKTPGSTLETSPRNALYEQRNGRFVDVAAAAGVADQGYGMGFCVGDIDADGRLDFLVTNYGPDRLYRNQGPDADGQVRFAEEAVDRGVADAGWGTGCAFADLDADGDLDLFVTRYVRFRFDSNPFCGDRARNLRAYCRPEAFEGQADRLYINRGDGSFREEGEVRGIVRGKNEKGFGVVISDLDDDGDPDIYVANDGTMNRLYVNDGGGHFQDLSLVSGSGLNEVGLTESGMGVALGDADADGRLDLVVTNYSMETNTLYRNQGGLMFEDLSVASGLKEPTFRNVGWGIAFVDVDNDGDLDLATANGHAVDNIEIFEAGLRYRQPNELLLNDGKGRFRPAGNAGPAFDLPQVSRALAVGDVDDDGRLDILITNTNGRPDLLMNRHPSPGHWVGIRLHGPPGNPFAIGSRVRLLRGRASGPAQEVRSGGSFLSQHDLRLHFGLGSHAGPLKIEITWPDGRRQRNDVQQVDAYVDVAWQKQ